MKAKKSEIFWTSILALALLIILYIVGLDKFLILWLSVGLIISLFGLAASEGALWMFLFPSVYILLLIYILVISCEYFYKKVIKPFNDKLNGENN